MAHFTQNMMERLFIQGWEFSNIRNSGFTENEYVYSNRKYPGVHILQRADNHFEIFSDNKYMSKGETFFRALRAGYDKGYGEGFKDGYEVGIEEGKKQGYFAAKKGIILKWDID